MYQCEISKYDLYVVDTHKSNFLHLEKVCIILLKPKYRYNEFENCTALHIIESKSKFMDLYKILGATKY